MTDNHVQTACQGYTARPSKFVA